MGFWKIRFSLFFLYKFEEVVYFNKFFFFLKDQVWIKFFLLSSYYTFHALRICLILPSYHTIHVHSPFDFFDNGDLCSLPAHKSWVFVIPSSIYKTLFGSVHFLCFLFFPTNLYPLDFFFQYIICIFFLQLFLGLKKISETLDHWLNLQIYNCKNSKF